MNTKHLLKYTILPDEARRIQGPEDWDRYAGALEKKPNDVWAISFINTNAADTTLIIEVQNYQLIYNGIYTIEAPTPGGTVDIRSIKIRWPNGNGEISVVLHRIKNLHYVEIPVIKA